MLSFARDPQGFINDWLQSQCRDLKVSLFIMTLGWIFYFHSSILADTVFFFLFVILIFNSVCNGTCMDIAHI